MPLFDAVYWIASEGHTKRVDVSDWDNAAETIIAAALGERLTVIGTRSGRSVPESIPAKHWQSVKTERRYTEPYLSLIGPASGDYPSVGEYQDQLFMIGQLLPMWTRLAVKEKDVRTVWSFTTLREAESISTARPAGRRGRPPNFDWPDVEQFVFQTMNEKGEFNDWDTEWKVQADLERLVAKYIETTCGDAPAESTIRENIGPMLRRWREQRKAGN
jgi:hypothetical protein